MCSNCILNIVLYHLYSGHFWQFSRLLCCRAPENNANGHEFLHLQFGNCWHLIVLILCAINSHLHISWTLDLWDIPLSFSSIVAMLLCLFVNTYTHIHCNWSILCHHLSLSTTDEGTDMLNHFDCHLDLCFCINISLRTLHEDFQWVIWQRWEANSLWRALAHRGCEENLWHCHIGSAILPAILYHFDLLFVYLLQAEKQQTTFAEK